MLYAAAAAMLVGAFFLAGAAYAPALALAGGFLAFGVALVPRRRGFRRARLDVKPGRVEVRRLVPLVIRAEDVTGATTASMHDGRIRLVLALRGRTHDPVVLDLASEAEVLEVRRALGLGHHGTGTIPFTVSWSPLALLASALHLLGLLSMCLLLAALLDSTREAALVFGLIGAIPSAFIGLPLHFSGLQADRVWLQQGGLELQLSGHMRGVAWGHLTSVEQDGRVLELDFANGERVRVGAFAPISASKAVLESLAAALADASRRARGLAAPKEEGPELVRVLARGPEERHGAWLARVDAAGRSVGAGPGGYRGAALSARDLFAVLEDPDAEDELRVAAGRALRVSTEDATTRARIDAAVAASARDRAFIEQIRIALDTPDAERAGSALESVGAAPKRR